MIKLIFVGKGSPGIRRAFEPFPAFILQVLFLQQMAVQGQDNNIFN
jgi:hypothetical protein